MTTVVDQGLPALGYALDPDAMAIELGPVLRPFLPLGARVVAVTPRVVTHKLRRRCVIAYDVDVDRGGARSTFRVIGKIRARKNGERAYELLRALWNAGFAADSRDAISVPEPIGLVGACGMWLQRRVQGCTSTALAGTRAAAPLWRRVADAAHKLHGAGVPPASRHTMDDELAILDRCFGDVAAALPTETPRLARLATLCQRIGAMLPEPAWRPSHRDFYGDQVLVEPGGRLFLIDFDLYCEADPGLDVGNFLGHLSEQALRQAGDSRALEREERALADRFEQVGGPAAAFAARVYAALTIARHVYISRRSSERRHTTAALMDLAERRAAMVAAEGGLA